MIAKLLEIVSEGDSAFSTDFLSKESKVMN